MTKTLGLSAIVGAIVLLTASGAATASTLVYKPLNPSFGGNPAMAAWYFELAAAQNKHGGGGGGGGGGGIDFGGGIGGPVIIINPGNIDVGNPDVDTDDDDEDVP